MVRKKKPKDYSHVKNQKNLLKEFAKKYPGEVIRFFQYYDSCLENNKTLYIDFTINNPPRYLFSKLDKKIFKRFYNLKFNIQFRRLFVTFMEYDLLGVNPKLKLEILSDE